MVSNGIKTSISVLWACLVAWLFSALVHSTDSDIGGLSGSTAGTISGLIMSISGAIVLVLFVLLLGFVSQFVLRGRDQVVFETVSRET